MRKGKFDRKPPALRIRDKVLIMCGGETEEIYFNHFKSMHKNVLQNVNVKIATYKNSNPMAVVKAAIGRKEDFDEVWAVFDMDTFFKEFDDAVSLALNSGVNCAFSNIAFEYWFYLHIENKTGAMSLNELTTELRKRLGFDYGKSSSEIRRTCIKISEKIFEAENRAQIGHERHLVNSGMKASKWCSCTTVYTLTRKLREWSVSKN